MRIVMTLGLASLGLASLACVGTAKAADCSALTIRNSVKMEPLARNGRVVVPITLDGVEKKFLFDTGGGINFISEATRQDLKLPEGHSHYRSTDLHGEASDSFVEVRDVEFGAAKTGGIQFQVMGNFGYPDGKAPFDGILATGYFAHDDIELDFAAEKVNFFSTDHCEGRVVYWPHQVLSVVPIDRTRGHLEVPVMLDGHPLTAMLDTGANRTVLNLTRAEQKIGFSPDAAQPPNRFKDNPDRQIYVRRFSTLSFDGVTIQNPIVVVQPLQYGNNDELVTGSKAEHKDDQANRLADDMLIGIDVLRHLHIYIATDENKLYVTEASTPVSASGPAPGSAPPAQN